MRFDPSAERLRLPGYGAYRSDEEDDIPDPFDAAIDRGVSGALGADMEFTPEEADAFNPNPDMAFSVDEVPGYTPDLNAAYQTATTAARNELAGPAAVPGYAAPVQPPQNAPVPAVAGQPPTAPPVPPPSQAVAPTGTGAAIPGYQNPLDTLTQPQTAPQGQQPQAPSPVQPAPGPERQAKARAGITTGSRSDRQRMAEAEHRDRVLRGVNAGIGVLGAILGGIGMGTRNRSLLGAGIAAGGIRSVIGHGGNAERERQRQADQTAREAAAVQAQQRDQQLGTDAERVAVGRLGAEAEAVRAEAGLLGERSEAELRAVQAADLAAERAAREGSVDGYREALRARIAAMPRGNPSRAEMIAFAQRDGSLDSINDMQALQNIMARVERLDVRRGGQGAGGAGGGRTENVTVEMPDGSFQTVSRRTGGTSAPAEVGDPFAAPSAVNAPPVAEPASEIVDPFAPPPAPVVAPSATRPRPARPAARRQPPAAVPAVMPETATATPGVASPEGTAIGTTTADSLNRFSTVLRQGRRDMNSPATRALLREYGALLDTGTDAARARAQTMFAEAANAASRAEAAGVPPELEEPIRRFTADDDFINDVDQWGAHRTLIGGMRVALANNRERFQAAMMNVGRPNFTEADPQTAELTRRLSGVLIPTLSRIAGANVTPQELDRVLQSLGLGSLVRAASNPSGFINSLNERLQGIQRRVRGRARANPAAASYVMAGALGNTPDYWGNALGGR